MKLYRQTKDIDFVMRQYHISKASLMRSNRLYDGEKESLTPKSHRPYSQHPTANTKEELRWISTCHRRNPNISICELYGKLRQEKAYSRHPGSLYRVFIRLGYRKGGGIYQEEIQANGALWYANGIGKKWQRDVKYVPIICYVGTDGENFYQYTVDFVQRALLYFGYAPDIIRTDNGGEFTHTQKIKRIYHLEVLCNNLHIAQKTIYLKTP